MSASMADNDNKLLHMLEKAIMQSRPSHMLITFTVRQMHEV